MDERTVASPVDPPPPLHSLSGRVKAKLYEVVDVTSSADVTSLAYFFASLYPLSGLCPVSGVDIFVRTWRAQNPS